MPYNTPFLWHNFDSYDYFNYRLRISLNLQHSDFSQKMFTIVFFKHVNHPRFLFTLHKFRAKISTSWNFCQSVVFEGKTRIIDIFFVFCTN